MLGLPKSTEFNRRIPKQKFYENVSVTPALKRVFIDQIKVIYWRNKIAATTMNVAAGETVTEIEVFEVRLTAPQLDVSVLKQIDKEIPYHILFLLEYEGKYQAWTAYKESAASGNSAFKVGTYYHTEWLLEQELPLKVDGLNTDAVYENFVRQIAGDALQADSAETLKESVTQIMNGEKPEAVKKSTPPRLRGAKNDIAEIDAIWSTMTDTERVIEHTVNDLIEDIQVNGKNYINLLRRTIEMKKGWIETDTDRANVRMAIDNIMNKIREVRLAI